MLLLKLHLFLLDIFLQSHIFEEVAIFFISAGRCRPKKENLPVSNRGLK